VVSYTEGETIAKENSLNFVETNCKEYHKVEIAFQKVAEGILDRIEKGVIPLNQGNGIKAGDLEKIGTLKEDIPQRK
jgi:hypothetical protein